MLEKSKTSPDPAVPSVDANTPTLLLLAEHRGHPCLPHCPSVRGLGVGKRLGGGTATGGERASGCVGLSCPLALTHDKYQGGFPGQGEKWAELSLKVRCDPAAPCFHQILPALVLCHPKATQLYCSPLSLTSYHWAFQEVRLSSLPECVINSPL